MVWKVKKTALMAMLLAFSLVIFVIEAQIPVIPVLPGAKPGFANIVTLVCLVFLRRREAFTVLFLRILLSCILASGFTGFLYSLSGGILSFLVMAFLIGRVPVKELWLISIAGGISHNIGQIAAASAVLNSTAVFAYLPFLILCGTATGLVNGIAAGFIIKNKHIYHLFKKAETI